MEKARYRIAVQTCMETFDYLIKNKLFVYDAGKDFLKSRIVIDEPGFVEETQSIRGNWDENVYRRKVPSIYVLKILIDNVDKALGMYNIPASPDKNYASAAFQNNFKTSEKRYSSYREIQNNFKKLREMQSEVNDSGKFSNDVYFDFGVKDHPLFFRTVECYAKLEEELRLSTYDLLMVDPYGDSISGCGYPYYEDEDGNYVPEDKDFKFSSEESYVDWDEFKENVGYRWEYLLDKGIDMSEPYNRYISVLGLDGKTK